MAATIEPLAETTPTIPYPTTAEALAPLAETTSTAPNQSSAFAPEPVAGTTPESEPKPIVSREFELFETAFSALGLGTAGGAPEKVPVILTHYEDLAPDPLRASIQDTLPGTIDPVPPASALCSVCGGALEPGAAFCIYCGHRVP